MTEPIQQLPDILAGPILRRLTVDDLVIWLAASKPLQMSLHLYDNDGSLLFSGDVAEFSSDPVQIGEHAYIYLIHYRPKEPFPTNTLFEYDLMVHTSNGDKSLVDYFPEIVYPGRKRPVIVIKPQLDHLLHCSCRKPHYTSEDALLRIDGELEKTVGNVEDRFSLMIMTGDQIYADDVGGPMLVAIHQAAGLLGLFPENLSGAIVNNNEELLESELCYYRREELLPRNKENKTLRDLFFGGTRKPIFTAASAHNHLVTLAEVSAMYLLIWSPALWLFIDMEEVDIPESHLDLYTSERAQVELFSRGLAGVQRMLAHVPNYMIFDDHDITDDWNLTRGWEEVAYENLYPRHLSRLRV